MKDRHRPNPFSFSGTVCGSKFINQIAERKSLRQDILNHQNVVLQAPRRYGKTSLVLQVFEDLRKEHDNFVGLHLDFFRIQSRQKFATLLLKEYGRKSGWSMEKALHVLKTSISSVRPSISLDGGGQPQLDLAFDGGSPDQKSFEEILELPQKLAERGQLVCVFLDEFQEIRQLNGEGFQQELRAAIQHHRNCSYIFCGSRQHLLAGIFGQADSPLFNIGKRMRLDRIPRDEFSRALRKKFKPVLPGLPLDDARRLYDEADGIPFYVQLLAYEVFNLASQHPGRDFSGLLIQALDKIQQDRADEHQLLYASLNPSQKKALDQVLKHGGRNLFQMSNLASSGIPASSLKKALQQLLERGYLQQEEGVYQFQDRFFGRWVGMG